MSICGLDFGTSNTTLGTIIDDIPVLAALEGDHVTIPSAIFYRADAGVHIGRRCQADRKRGSFALVSRFRSSSPFAEPRFELRNRKDTSKSMDLVWLWFRSPHNEPAATMLRTSEPPHYRKTRGAIGA